MSNYFSADELPPVADDKSSNAGYHELAKTILVAVFIALAMRSLAYEPFSIPSSSMEPTLLVGDYLFVSKYAYGYSKYSFPLSAMIPFEGRIAYKQPARGDIAVFRKPHNENIDYIKRIVGLPGDVIKVTDGRLLINGERVARFRDGVYSLNMPHHKDMVVDRYVEHLPEGRRHLIIEQSDQEVLDNTPSYTVPEGHIFVMGDNRDGSQDSRVVDEVGFVPIENLVGRAELIFFSIDGARPWQIWKWPWRVRFSRLLSRVPTLGDKKASGGS